MVLEGDEASVIGLRSAQVEFLGVQFLVLPDCLPKQKRHPAQVMERRVRAAVLVNEAVLVRQREDTGDRLTLLGGDADGQFVAKAGDKISKPGNGLRRKLMPAASEQE